MRLHGKVALITGAGSGIGRATAERFAAAGARVAVCDIVPERVDEVVAAIRDAGGEALGITMDIARQEDVDRAVASTLSAYGRLDILVNNAGIMDRMLPVADVPDDLWDRIMAVNVTGPFRLTRRIVPIMLKQGSGSIVNVSSVAGLGGGKAGTAYTTSKHALLGLTKSVAWLHAREGIRCNAVCPGGVETNIGMGGEPSEAGLARLGVGFPTAVRTGDPEEIANVILFLASDEASLVNGVAVAADAGWVAM